MPSSPLTIPTYEGSNQPTEPCVRYFSGGWNGWKYWMAMNPVNNGDTSHEDASIVVSNNGSTWQVPVGLTNPVAPTPPNGNNADAALYYDVATATMYLYWIWQAATISANNGVWWSSSTDGVTWAAGTQMLAVGGLLEPKVVKLGAGSYRLYTIDDGGLPYQMRYREATTPFGPWGSPSNVTVTNALATVPFHMDLILEPSGRFVMPYCDTSGARVGWIAASNDGITFTSQSRPFLPASLYAWSSTIYRPSLQKQDNGLYSCWMGAIATAYRIGYTADIPPFEIPTP